MPKRAKILLTGGNGFLGKALTPGLMVKYDLATLGKSDHNNFCCDLTCEAPNFDREFDLVIHGAGRAHIKPRTDLAKQEFFRVNLSGTENLARGLESCRNPPKALVFISSVAVYGINNGNGISVDQRVSPTTAYAKSKTLAEEFLQKWCDKLNIPLIILRLPLIVAPYPPGNLGAMMKAIKNRYYFRIGEGQARKSMVWAEDIVTILPFLPNEGGTYILTDGHHPSLRQLEDAIASGYHNGIVPSIPFQVAKVLAKAGDNLGNNFPFNSQVLKKLDSTLTFSDAEARKDLHWDPTPVLSKISEIVGN